MRGVLDAGDGRRRDREPDDEAAGAILFDAHLAELGADFDTEPDGAEAAPDDRDQTPGTRASARARVPGAVRPVAPGW